MEAPEQPQQNDLGPFFYLDPLFKVFVIFSSKWFPLFSPNFALMVWKEFVTFL